MNIFRQYYLLVVTNELKFKGVMNLFSRACCKMMYSPMVCAEGAPSIPTWISDGRFILWRSQILYTLCLVFLYFVYCSRFSEGSYELLVFISDLLWSRFVLCLLLFFLSLLFTYDSFPTMSSIICILLRPLRFLPIVFHSKIVSSMPSWG